MRTLLIFLFVISFGFAQGQGKNTSIAFVGLNHYSDAGLNIPDPKYFDFGQDLELISVKTQSVYFSRSYLINKEGESVSTGFMPSMYFRPNDNRIVVTGQKMESNDSLNPYGAKDISSAILYSTVNSFISKIRFNKR